MNVVVYYYNRESKKRYNITSVTARVEVYGSVEQLYRSARIEIIDRQAVKYFNSERVRIYSEGKLIFDGRIFRVDNNATTGVTLMCFDNAYYFKKFETNAVYRPVGQPGNEKGVRLSDMVKRLARRAGVSTGYIKQTTYEHGDINYAGESMQTILQGLIGLEKERTGRRYYLMMRGSTLELRERGGVDGIFLNNATMLDATATVDATEIVTRLRVYGKFEEDVQGTSTPASSMTLISSSNYRGPDSTGYQSGFRQRLKNTDQWDDLILKVASAKAVDPLMLKIMVMMESSGNPELTSNDGAGSMGLTQITPGNVDLYVNPARLFEPEYNLEKACDILRGPKFNTAKNLSYTPSVKNMVHLWNGWPPSQGENDSPYANTFASIYIGFGGDPNARFDRKSDYKPAKTETKQIIDPLDVEAANKALEKRFGIIEQTVTLSANSPTDLGIKAKALAAELREKKTVSVDCIGHPNGISGRRVQFQDNPVASGIWYIHSDTHIFEPSGYTMRLELTKYDETPAPEVPIFPEEDASERPAALQNSNPDGGTGTFIRPAPGSITQYFGAASGANGYTFHNGIDIGNAIGTKVVASDGGMVTKARNQGAYGNHVEIVHAINQKRWTTLYAHLSKINVKVGQFVQQGDVIGLMGSTGNSTGPHLHFEIHNGERIYHAHKQMNSVDPLKYFK